jgi:Ca2+-binding RTX toxin-like protein
MAIKHGTAGADTLAGTAGADQLFGEGGNDVLRGLAGPDTLDGGDGRDTADYSGSAGPVGVRLDDGFGSSNDAEQDVYHSIENAVGSRFDDFLFGDGAANRLDGGRGADDIVGGGGNDTLNGGGGVDGITGGAGAELINGGGGNDFLSYANSVLGVNVNLSTGLATGGDAAGDTVKSVENLIGSAGGDVLAGTLGDNFIQGSDGADRLFGFAGDDALFGGAGADTMTGGAGADRFFYNNAADQSPTGFFTRDVILDFARADGDVIDLRSVDAVAGTPGDQGFEFLGFNGSLDVPGHIEYVFEGDNTVVRVNTAGDNAPDMEIQLSGHVNLAAVDFLL